MKYANPIKVIFSLTENGESRFAFASASVVFSTRPRLFKKIAVCVKIYMFC